MPRPSRAPATFGAFALAMASGQGVRAQAPSANTPPIAPSVSAPAAPPNAPPAPAAPPNAPPAPVAPLTSAAPGRPAFAFTPPPREAAQGRLLPKPRPEEAPPTRIRFVAEPVSDGAILSLSFGVAALSEAILGTGEIVPQQPQSTDRLLSIDRGAVAGRPASGWAAISNVGLFGAIGFAVVDPVLSGFRHGPDAGVADAFIYGESVAVTWSVTNLAKIAFRRPRPSAYREQQELYDQYGEVNAPAISDTDSALSFFSGHASLTAAVASTATYLAFARSPRSPRPWVTLGVGALATALTSVGRVRGGKHFPTDVVAGAMAGVGIGILVPHLHRSDDAKQRPVWVGVAPSPGGGGGLSLGGQFLRPRRIRGAREVFAGRWVSATAIRWRDSSSREVTSGARWGPYPLPPMNAAFVPAPRAPRPAPGPTWVQVGAGRLALRGRPKLALLPQLRGLGCDRLVTLLSAREGALTLGRAAQASGLAWTWAPLENGRRPADLAARTLARTARELVARLGEGEGEGVLIHCAAGLHRTGMLAYAVLRLLGLSPEGARARLAELRRETVEAMREHHFAWGDDLADGGVVCGDAADGGAARGGDAVDEGVAGGGATGAG